jgi:hypothetical protein
VVVDAGGEEHEPALLAGAGLGEAEDVAIEPAGGVEVADEQGDVAELANGEAGRRASGPRRWLHGAGSVPLPGHG